MNLDPINPEVISWREKYLFLPAWLRDFHAQKRLFKTIHESMDIKSSMPSHGKSEIDWITAHCYVIDIFLWFMARHGYTLQKSRTKLEFNDISNTLDYWAERRSNSFVQMIEREKKLRKYRKSATYDINGVEIIEGSIINADGFKSHVDKNHFHCVFYDNGFYSDIYSDADPISSYSTIEVVGHAEDYREAFEKGQYEGNLGLGLNE